MDNLYQQAVECFKAGDKPKTKLLLEEFIKSEPNNADALFGLSMCSNTFDHRKYYLERVLAINPNYPKAREALDKLIAEQPKVTIPAQATSQPINPPKKDTPPTNQVYKYTTLPPEEPKELTKIPNSQSWLDRNYLYLVIGLIIVILLSLAGMIIPSLTPKPIAAILQPTETEYVLPPTWTPVSTTWNPEPILIANGFIFTSYENDMRSYDNSSLGMGVSFNPGTEGVMGITIVPSPYSDAHEQVNALVTSLQEA
jgi:hypothetical protein